MPCVWVVSLNRRTISFLWFRAWEFPSLVTLLLLLLNVFYLFSCFCLSAQSYASYVRLFVQILFFVVVVIFNTISIYCVSLYDDGDEHTHIYKYFQFQRDALRINFRPWETLSTRSPQWIDGVGLCHRKKCVRCYSLWINMPFDSSSFCHWTRWVHHVPYRKWMKWHVERLKRKKKKTNCNRWASRLRILWFDFHKNVQQLSFARIHDDHDVVDVRRDNT